MENDKIRQIRMDALVADYLYSIKIARLNKFKMLIDILTIILPIFVTAVLLVLKNTSYEKTANLASVLLSSALLCLVVLSLLLKFDDKKIGYHIGKKDNIYIATEALKLICEIDEKLSWFYSYVAEMDNRDSNAIGTICEHLRKKAYRQALKKLIPGSTSVVCPICFTSPFTYKKGNCQVCGNTQKQKEV